MMTVKTKISDEHYSGLLAEPMRPRGLVATSEDHERREHEWLARIIILFDHFGIDWVNDDNPWLSLAIALANRHVPGFQPPSRTQGRPKEREYDAISIVYLVKLLNLRDGLSTRAAIKRIAEIGSVQGSEERLRDIYQRSVGHRYGRSTSFGVKILDQFCRDCPRDNVIASLEEVVGNLLREK